MVLFSLRDLRGFVVGFDLDMVLDLIPPQIVFEQRPGAA